MELKELALQYRESSALCRDRALELRAHLRDFPECSGETVALRRRISILEGMAREAWATSKYLENYYRRPESDGEKNKKDAAGKGDRGAELEALCKAIREAGKQRRRPYSRGA